MDARDVNFQVPPEPPRASLNLELLPWLDPTHPDGQSQLIRTIFALRNQNGGTLIIGLYDYASRPSWFMNWQRIFNQNMVQEMISRFASEYFPIEFRCYHVNNQEFPCIIVPAGVQTPVAVKTDLPAGSPPLCVNDVYVRTASPDGGYHSEKISWKDWPQLMDIFFANRESVRGIRLARSTADLIRDKAESYLRECRQQFQYALTERNAVLPSHGTWEAVLIIDGQVPEHHLNHKFLNLIDSGNPQYTGWPVWLVSQGFRNPDDRPRPVAGAWQQLIIASMMGLSVDFIRFDPRGYFYQLRALQEDMIDRPNRPKATKELDFVLPIIRVAEAIAVGISLAKSMGCPLEETTLGFLFCWTMLKGRMLVSFVERQRPLIPRGPAYEDNAVVFVPVPLNLPLTALGGIVEKVVRPLFEIFDGFTLSSSVVEELTRRIVEKRRSQL